MQLPAWSRVQKPKPPKSVAAPQWSAAQPSQQEAHDQDSHDQRLASTGQDSSQCSTSTCQAPAPAAPPSLPQTPRIPRNAPPKDPTPPESLGDESLTWANGARWGRVHISVLMRLHLSCAWDGCCAVIAEAVAYNAAVQIAGMVLYQCLKAGLAAAGASH